jgi:hypothetical protein
LRSVAPHSPGGEKKVAAQFNMWLHIEVTSSSNILFDVLTNTTMAGFTSRGDATKNVDPSAKPPVAELWLA